MNMIWRSGHGQTFDIPFFELDSFFGIKEDNKNHSDFLFYSLSPNTRDFKNASAFLPRRAECEATFLTRFTNVGAFLSGELLRFDLFCF